MVIRIIFQECHRWKYREMYEIDQHDSDRYQHSHLGQPYCIMISVFAHLILTLFHEKYSETNPEARLIIGSPANTVKSL